MTTKVFPNFQSTNWEFVSNCDDFYGNETDNTLKQTIINVNNKGEIPLNYITSKLKLSQENDMPVLTLIIKLEQVLDKDNKLIYQLYFTKNTDDKSDIELMIEKIGTIDNSRDIVHNASIGKISHKWSNVDKNKYNIFLHDLDITEVNRLTDLWELNNNQIIDNIMEDENGLVFDTPYEEDGNTFVDINF